MSKVVIDWNPEYYHCLPEETVFFSEEDVKIHDNGWVTIEQNSDHITHYPPHRILSIRVARSAE